MKSRLFFAVFLFISLQSFGQLDTLYMNGKKVAASVKEITPDAVKFSYPNEDLVNSVYKNSIQQIVFANGRTQTFTESTSFKSVGSVEDYENVTVTGVEGEIKGLYKLGEVSSKAKGTTTLSNQERVKERAYRKMKIEASMMGANIVYLTDQRTEGNKAGGYFQASSAAETNLTGIAYSNQVPSHDDFKALLGENIQFITDSRYRLWSSNADYKKEVFVKLFSIDRIFNENGITIIEGVLDGERRASSFQLASVDEEGFNIFYTSKSTAFNVRITF